MTLADDIFETVDNVSATITLPSGKRHSGRIVVTHFRPGGSGPFPVVIFNHGRAKEDRQTVSRYRYLDMARFLVRRGFAVFLPTRLGYGDAGTDPDPESNSNACTERQYSLILDVMIDQTEATLQFAKAKPWVDSRRVLVMGYSYGGYAAIGAIGTQQLKPMAAINFVGGAGGTTPGSPPCGASEVETVIANAGKKAGGPMLWLYAENDRYWGNNWPRKWHAAYVKAGGKAELTVFPPLEDDGHKLFAKGFHLWRPIVDRFLQKLGFPPPKSANAPAPSGFARIEEVDKVPYVEANAKIDGYAKFLAADLPRAFVVSTNGVWAWRSGENAVDRALTSCKETAKGSCQLYAVDDAVVFKPPTSSQATFGR